MAINYDIYVNYKTTGEIGGTGTKEKVGDLAKKVKDVEFSFSSLGKSVQEGLGNAVDMISTVVKTVAGLGVIGATAFAGIGTAAVKMNSVLESTQIAMAAVFNANGASASFGSGMTMASAQIAKMRKDAAELPGEFQDLVGIFQTIAPNTMRLGMSADETRKLATMTMTTAAVDKIPMQQAAREMAMLIEGRAGGHNVLGLRMGLSGDRAKEFNQKSEIDHVKYLTEEMGKLTPAVDAFKHSFDGLWSTTKDNAKQFVTILGAPLFDSVKNTLEKFNTWFDSGKALQWANDFGIKLGAAFDYAQDKIVEWWPSIKMFAVEVYNELKELFVKVKPYVLAFGGWLKDSLEHPKETIQELKHVLEMYAAYRIAGPIAGNLIGQGLGMMVAGAGGGIEGAGAVALAAAPYALVAGGAAYAGYESANSNSLSGDISRNINSDTADQWSLIKSELNESARSASNALHTVGDAFEIYLVEPLGVYVNGALNMFVETLHTATFGLSSLGQWIDGKLGKLDHINETPEIDRSYELAPTIKAMNSFADSAEKDEKTKNKVPNHTTHIQKVEIVLQSNQDPNRIARLTKSALEELAAHPRGGVLPKYLDKK